MALEVFIVSGLQYREVCSAGLISGKDQDVCHFLRLDAKRHGTRQELQAHHCCRNATCDVDYYRVLAETVVPRVENSVLLAQTCILKQHDRGTR